MPYKNVNVSYVEPLDLNSLNQAVNTLQKRHDATIQMANKLKSDIADLNLNEKEAQWRADLISQINDKLNEIDINDFKGYGYNDIVNLAGDITSNPALKDRLKYQKDFTDWQKLIDNRTDIDQRTKDWAKSLLINQYDYKDTINSEGKIIGGNNFQAGYNPVKETSILDLINTGFKIINKKVGNNQSTMFYNDTDGYHTDYKPGDVERIVSSNSFQSLSVKDLKNAVRAAINSDSDFIRSIQQEYDVDMWEAEKNGQGLDSYNSETENIPIYKLRPDLYINDKAGGRKRTLDEYIDYKITGAAEAHSYYYGTNKNISKEIKYGKGNTSGSNNGNGDGAYKFYDTNSNVVPIANSGRKETDVVFDGGVELIQYSEDITNQLIDIINE